MSEIVINSLLKNKEKEELNHIFSPLLSLDSTKIQIFVHGSWADNTKTAFSDLDDFIIIEDEYYNIVKHKLEQVELNFQRIDPLQHHGHWLVKKSQLTQYDNSYMPIFIMEDAICLIGSNQIKTTINQISAINNTIKRVKNTCRNIEFFYNKYKEGVLNIYDLKRFIGSIVLLPPLIFQVKGQQLDKRTAIKNSSSIYSTGVLKLIEWSSECRENWGIIIKETTYLDFSNELQKFDNAEKWRKYSSINSPVLNYEGLSSIEINDKLIEDFINETLYHIDAYKFQRKELTDYEEAFQKIKRISIENNAILIGQFGSIKYPSISDLDVFICFEDHNYNQGCLAVDNFIQNDISLSYLFTHSPLYVCKSMLHDIKFLHTIYDLNIVYNPFQIELKVQLEKEYQDFLNTAWSYLIMLTMNTITKDIKYYDIRTILLSLKNAQTSVFNLEERLGITSNELNINHNTRITVLKEGIKSRKLVEAEYHRVHAKLDMVLKQLDKKVPLIKKEFKILDTYYRVAFKTRVKNENGHSIFCINKIFSNLIFSIYKKRDKNSKKYWNTIRKNAKLHKKYGGYINTYIWVVPSKFVIYNAEERILLKLKTVLFKSIKKIKNFFQ